MSKKVEKLKVIDSAEKSKARECDMKMLRDVMADLRSGKVEEIAIVGLNKDGSMMRGWSHAKTIGNAFRMIGSMEKMREEYMRKNIEA